MEVPPDRHTPPPVIPDVAASYPLADLTYDRTNSLGEGGAAEIFRCTTSDGRALILKLYNEEVLTRIDFDALRHLIAWPAALSEEDRTKLMELCAWPLALVTGSGGAVVGLVMPEAPAKFFLSRNDLTEPRHFSRLAVRKERAEKTNFEYYDFPQKIARLGHLLSGLQFLNANGIVVGDLQWNNILTTGPGTEGSEVLTDVYFVDCDSFIVHGRSALPNMDPLSWRPPYPTTGFSPTTDLFKFALTVIRCLSEQANQDSIAYAQYRELLPSNDYGVLHELLTKPNPTYGADDLNSMARAWQLSVKRDGRMYRRTDAFARQPWTPEMRAAHLAGLDAAQPTVARTPPPTDPPPGPDGSSGRWSSKRGWWLAVAVILVVAGLIALAVVQSKKSNHSSSTYSSTSRRSTTSATYTSTFRYTPPPPPPVPRGLRSAAVGDCLHYSQGAANPDGTKEITDVRIVPCGAADATVRVTKRANSSNECPTGKWLRSGPAPFVFFCYVDV